MWHASQSDGSAAQRCSRRRGGADAGRAEELHGELSGGRPMVQNPTVPTPSSSDLTDWLPSPNGEPIAAYDNAGEEGTPAIRTVA
jgi:hypothetical protein